MSVFSTRLKQRSWPAADTLAVVLEKPAGFSFTSGQFITLHLPGDPSLVPGRGRYDFSVASMPDDPDLLLVMRFRQSLFKQHLLSLPLDTKVDIEGPFGMMTIPPAHTRPVVLLAGGIGVAPFRSMILHAITHKESYPITLMYSNPTLAHVVFFDEFTQLANRYSGLTFIPVLTRPEEKDQWTGETGHFTAELLSRALAHPPANDYYIVGPVRMVIPSKRQLKSIGVAEESIHMEIFTGY